MNIVSVDTHLRHNALCIYVAGCNQHCEGCHNPTAWDFAAGAPWQEWQAHIKASAAAGPVHKLWIMGGEPLDQDQEAFLSFLFWLYGTVAKPLWLFTGHAFADVPPVVLTFFEKVKHGRFILAEACVDHIVAGVPLASRNQTITTV